VLKGYYVNCYLSKLQLDKYAFLTQIRFFVTNTSFFGFVLSRLLLRHLGLDLDFAQISEQKLVAEASGHHIYFNQGFCCLQLLDLNARPTRNKVGYVKSQIQ